MKTALATILAALIATAPVAFAKDKAQPAKDQTFVYSTFMEETPAAVAYDYSKDDLTKVTLADDEAELVALNDRLKSARIWSRLRHEPRVFIRGEEDQAKRYAWLGTLAESVVTAYEDRITALKARIDSRKAKVAAK